MFQNPTIAKAYGVKVTEALIAKGAMPTTARLQGRMAEVKELKRLNAWTVANVGLD